MATTLSVDGLEAIARFEGLRLTAYKPDPGEQFWTIGYGHYGPDVPAGGRITRDRALVLLRYDVQGAVDTVRSALHVKVAQGAFDALVSFAFNVGGGAFRSSTLLRKLNAGRPLREVAGEFGRWVKGASGKVLGGLVERRKIEAATFLRGAAKAGAAAWLTAVELRRVRELDALHAKRLLSPSDVDRMRVLVRVLTEQRKAIWRAAQGAGGWDALNRRARYRSLVARTT